MKTSIASRLLLFAALVAASLHAASPPNDDFDAATVLAGSSVSLTTTNTGATKERSEPDHAGNEGGTSLWWTWTAPSDGELEVDTDGSDIDTLLAIYSGGSLATLTELGANDDHGFFVTSRVRFVVQEGLVCRLAVDGFGGDSGMIVLNLSFLSGPIARPANDDFTNSLSLTAVPVLLSGANVQATREVGEPNHAGQPGDASVWWHWVAPFTEKVRITTEGSEIDTLLAVYQGLTLTNLSQVATNDDTDQAAGLLHSTVDFDARAGDRYEIALDGYDGEMGGLQLRIESFAPRFEPLNRLPDGSTELVISTLSGSTNELQASADFQSWSSLGFRVGTDGRVRFTDTGSDPGPRFYRARRLGPP